MVENAADHWMSAMLSPKSIALIGASTRVGSFGHTAQDLLEKHAYPGKLYLVNPRYESINTLECYADLESLPQVPDLVIIVLGSQTIEAVFNSAMALGAGGVVIFANNYLEDDIRPPLLQRLKNKARDAGIPVCGGNCMGFYNYTSDTLVSFDTPPDRNAGHISLIAHSGSVMTYLANTDPRLMFNLAVSPGQEINGTVADYMLYALVQPETRVIAIFVETIRDPVKFILALKTAQENRIPVVVVKVGATEKSARMAASHSGAVAGSDTAFQAICDHYGAIRVKDMDELAATALAFSQGKYLGKGGLSSLLDSGGLREQMIDLSEENGVRFSNINQKTKSVLEEILEYGLIAENPVDAMGSLNVDVAENYHRILQILDQDPDTAMLSLEFEFRDSFSQYPQMLDVALDIQRQTDKPFFVINSTTNVSNSENALALGKVGIPVINGISLALSAMGNLFRFRDQTEFETPAAVQFDEQLVSKWRDKLHDNDALDEIESLNMLSEFGLPVVAFLTIDDDERLLSAANEIGYPLVLKSAQPGLQHKSDAGGVIVNLRNADELGAAYEQMSKKLGSRCVLAPMVGDGVELSFGMVNDEQFGPIVMVCAGGIYIELLDDRRFIPGPCSEAEALHHIQSLKIYKILAGARGRPPCRVDLVARALSDFSQLAYVMVDVISEMDMNPVIVTPDGCTIVDALVVK